MNKPMTTRPKQKAGHESDHFQTPVYAIAPLLKYIKGYVYECAAGDGNIVNFLNKNSLGCFGTDIKDGIDFLEYELHSLPQFDLIVTNPPYSLKEKFTRKCYEIGKPFALLMPITIEANLCEMFDKHGAELIIPYQRIRFITPKQRETGRDYYWRCRYKECNEAHYTEHPPKVCDYCYSCPATFKRCKYSPQIKTIWVTHGLNIGRDITYVDLKDYGYPDDIYA